MKKEFKEALGVPQNITNTAVQIYNDIMSHIPKDADFEDLNGYETEIEGDYQFAGLKINDVNFEIEIRKHEDLVLLGMATSDNSKLENNFNLKTKTSKIFNLSFKYVGPETTTGEDIIKHMVDDRLEYIGSIAHELKHKYDYFKKPVNSLSKRVKYDVGSGRGFGSIETINEFIHFLYYGHVIESLVRPSEIAAIIESGGITKKDFYKFLTDTRTYQRLNELKNFTYEKFYDGIKNEIDKVKDLFDHNDISYEGETDDEIVDEALRLLYLNLRDWKAENMHRRLVSGFHEMFLGFSGEKEIFFNNYLKSISKFDEDYEKFFHYEIKLFNHVGTKMIKKIAKLYDLARETQNESIINWEVWRLLNENNMKIETKPKFNYKKR